MAKYSENHIVAIVHKMNGFVHTFFHGKGYIITEPIFSVLYILLVPSNNFQITRRVCSWHIDSNGIRFCSF